MPLDMPESVLVRFKGEMQPGDAARLGARHSAVRHQGRAC